jgi:hypothetical protein
MTVGESYAESKTRVNCLRGARIGRLTEYGVSSTTQKKEHQGAPFSHFNSAVTIEESKMLQIWVQNHN